MVYNKIKQAYPDKPLYYWIDSTKLESTRWVAVILRNLPRNCKTELICLKWSSNGEKVLYAEQPIYIESWYWWLVRVGSIQDAYKICNRLNGKELAEGMYLKADVHPNSNFRKQDVIVPEATSPEYLYTPIETQINTPNPTLNPEWDKTVSEKPTIVSPPLEGLRLATKHVPNEIKPQEIPTVKPFIQNPEPPKQNSEELKSENLPKIEIKQENSINDNSKKSQSNSDMSVEEVSNLCLFLSVEDTLMFTLITKFIEVKRPTKWRQ